MFNFKNVYINNFYTVVSNKEANGNIKKPNVVMNDYYFKEKTPFKAEVKMINTCLNNLPKPDLVVAANLSNQLGTSNISMRDRNIPYLGLYTACSSFSLSLINLGVMIDNKNIKSGLSIISSHNLNAEKQFRFPIEYGAPKLKRSTQTATCAIGIYLSNIPSKYKVVNGTIGTVVDSYITDAYNMGGVMAYSACKTLIDHLTETKTSIKDYDLILTGDLGKTGTSIFLELLNQKGLNPKKHIDAGAILYKDDETSGASGPACLPLVFFYNIINNKKYKKILLLSTGSLHNPEMVNQKETIPAITNAVTIEVIEN